MSDAEIAGTAEAVAELPKTGADVASQALNMVEKNLDALGTGVQALVNKALEGGGDIMTFLQAEIPEVLQQLIHWKIAETSICVLFNIAMIYAVVFGFKKGYAFYKARIEKWEADKQNGPYWGNEDNALMTAMPCGIYIVFGGIWILCCVAEGYEKLQELAQLVVAPKVYILQYLSQYF